MKFWGSSTKLLHTQSSCPTSPGSLSAWWQREFWAWKKWTKWWGEWESDPTQVFPLPPPPPILSHVITESVAGSNQQRGHRYLKPKENIFCQQIILTFSFHPSPNTHPHKDENRTEQPCFILCENWVVQGLDACPYTCGHGVLGQCNHHYPEEVSDLCTLQRAI